MRQESQRKDMIIFLLYRLSFERVFISEKSQKYKDTEKVEEFKSLRVEEQRD